MEWQMSEEVCGSRKTPKEAHAVQNTSTGEHALSNDKIKEALYKHPKNNEPEIDVRNIVNLMNKLHKKTMEEADDEPMVIPGEEFNKTIDKFDKFPENLCE